MSDIYDVSLAPVQVRVRKAAMTALTPLQQRDARDALSRQRLACKVEPELRTMAEIKADLRDRPEGYYEPTVEPHEPWVSAPRVTRVLHLTIDTVDRRQKQIGERAVKLKFEPPARPKVTFGGNQTHFGRYAKF